jgi:hypothetical protein
VFCENVFMNRVRILLVLLIAFTLPWQGVAATTRVHCVVMGGSAAAMHVPQHAGGSHGAHKHAADATTADRHHAHATHGDMPATGDSKADCSAFCCAATISASPAQMIVPVPTLPLLPEIPAVRPTYDPDGFDRPPRT